MLLEFLLDSPLLININSISTSNTCSSSNYNSNNDSIMKISLDDVRILKRKTINNTKQQQHIKALYDNIINTFSTISSNTTNTITVSEILALSFNYFQLLYSTSNTTTATITNIYNNYLRYSSSSS